MGNHSRAPGPGSDAEPDRIGRTRAARHLLHPLQVRESLALAAQPGWRAACLAGLQAAVAAAIALPLVLVSPWPHLVGYASLGALVALFGRFAPPAGRSRIVLHCAALQTFVVFAMSLAAWLGMPWLLQLLLLALGCGPLFLASNLGSFGPPGALIFVFAASASMGRTDSLAAVIERVAATGIVALLAWAILVQSPPAWVVIFALVMLMVATELIIGSNYALGQVLVTPMALLMTWLAMPGGAGLDMVPERVIDTVLGATIGIVVSVLSSTADDRAHLALHHAGRTGKGAGPPA